MALYYEMIQHCKSIFPLSGSTYFNISDQDQWSHEAGYQLAKLTQGFLCVLSW